MDGILSIQSWVSYGKVGNAVAVFALQRLGFETWAVNTVQFSNHTGYGDWRGRVATPGEIADLVAGIAGRGAFAHCRAILTGYLGDPALGQVVLDTVAHVRAANPDTLWLCDPVMGDVGRGFFVPPAMPPFFRERALPMADIVTPNQFELEYLTGLPIIDLPTALAAAAAVRARGPKIVLVTSLTRADGPADRIESLVSTDAGAWLVATPRLALAAHGAGDLVAALFLAHWLKSGGDAAAALAQAVSGLFGVLQATARSGESELQIIAAQQALVTPALVFAADRVA